MITEHASALKKAPSWLYKAGAQLYIDKTYPRHLFIETTAKCNLSCSYCPREDASNHMDFELFRQILDEASEYGPRSFSLHLFGEPLLYPRILDAVEYIKRKNKRNRVLLTTNGTYLNKFVDELIRLRVDRIIWSWRKEARFKPETIEKLKRWGKFLVRILIEETPKEEYERWKEWQPIEYRNLHNYGGEVDLQKYGVQTTDTQRWPCYHLWLAPAVAWNGNILICCSDPHQKEVIGRFPEVNVAEAWKKIELLRESHLRGEFNGICRDCDVWKQYPDLFFKWQKSS